MSAPAFKQEIRSQVYDKISQIAATLGSPARLRIIQILAQSPRGVDELSEIIGESVANTSQHLQRLAREQLVKSDKNKNVRIYKISHPLVLNLWETLQDLSQELAPDLKSAELSLTNAEYRDSILPNQVLSAVRAKAATLVDVREPKEAESSPVSGALNIPLSELKNRLEEISKKKTVYVVCRGRFCSLATEAVELLRSEGFKAYRLRESPFSLSILQGGRR